MARLVLVYAALFFWVALAAAAQYEYNKVLKGCYERLPDDFHRLSLARNHRGRERCAVVCSQRGKPFVAFGITHCFCADSEPPSTSEVHRSRCEAVGLDGWSVPRTRQLKDAEEQLFIVFEIKDLEWQSDDLESATQRKATSLSQPVKPAALSSPPDQSKHLGCFVGHPVDVPLTKIAVSEDGRRDCARLCGKEGKAAVVFSSLKCGCTDNVPNDAIRTEDIRCSLQVMKKNFRTELVYSVWSTGHGLDMKGYEATMHHHLSKPEEIPTDLSQSDLRPRHACYRNPPPPKDRRYKVLFPNNPALCYSFCKKNDKRFVFLQGSDCWCSDLYPSREDRLDSDECHDICDEGLSRCGGNFAVSVYNLGDQPRPEAQPKKPDGKCFSSRAFTSRQVIGLGRSEDFRGVCLDRCKEKGDAVAMIHGSNCWCAKTYPHDVYSSDLDSCNLSCQGDNSHCGGTKGSRIYYSAYETGNADIVRQDPLRRRLERPVRDITTWHGCWSEPPLTADDNAHILKSNTVTSCSNFCWRQNSAVAAVRQNSCLCAKSYPVRSKRSSDSLCKFACRGYPYDDCGGYQTWTIVNTGLETYVPYDLPRHQEHTDDDDTWNVYKSGLDPNVRTDPTLKSAHGCFKFRRLLSQDDTPQLLRVDISGANRSRNGDSCTAKCAEVGYGVALRHERECFCSPGLPHESKRVDDKWCSYSCRGDRLEMCGGAKARYTVYKTDAYKPDLQKEKKLKHEDPSPSLDDRPQCLHPILENAHEMFNEASTKVATVTQSVQDGFFWVRDKGQDIFDVCLWNIMVFFSNVLYRLGLSSGGDGIEL
ncbi:hypothetical protein FLONG3_1785 [Fusarium longipes]|uniref:WSC domain-containing protein n=1 Tax=Fusarium longipes TaxID=694270 RepID=A0A395T5I8_9HYPO|nr:hypothetical protein FLONG3_1785 [Fusarium longipes]